MKKVCYWCGKPMATMDGNHQGAVLYSICDECSHRVRLDERLPDLLCAIATLRAKNGNKELHQSLDVLTSA